MDAHSYICIKSLACTIPEFVHHHLRSLGLRFMLLMRAPNREILGELRQFLARFPSSSHQKQSHFNYLPTLNHNLEINKALIRCEAFNKALFGAIIFSYGCRMVIEVGWVNTSDKRVPNYKTIEGLDR